MKRGEFGLINDFVKAFARPRAPLVLGPGDDCALLRAKPGEELVLTVDALVEGVHFTKRFTPEEIGHKALAVNLSDLAAMGARPVAFLVAIAMPERWLAKLPGIARGMSRLAERCGCQLAGGNMSRARELSITVTALGAVPAGRALRRDGARPGDRLLVSGALGGAAAGLRKSASHLRARQRTPEPRVALGLLARDVAHAAIDISDGLAQDLRHVLQASKVGALLVDDAIPLERGATLANALSGGEDYELLLAVPPKRAAALIQASRRLGLPLTDIGWVTRRVGLSGTSQAVAGHDHFRSRN
ncbi:MAG: thiamine-phosphate kinase [Deltaproteobacteria bacterium]|nr:thiamine-phosphate kinase [Deltaproteobacteria bacterium]